MVNTKWINLRSIAIFWSIFIGIGALGGSLMMFIDPTGKMMGMEPMLESFQVLPWPHIFFRNFIFPGISLLLANGITNFISLFLLLRKNRYGALSSVICGIILMLWICIQFIIFPLNILSTLYFFFGFFQALNGIFLMRKEKRDQVHNT